MEDLQRVCLCDLFPRFFFSETKQTFDLTGKTRQNAENKQTFDLNGKNEIEGKTRQNDEDKQTFDLSSKVKVAQN